MENIVDCVLRNLIATRTDIFTGGSSYSYFEPNDNFDWNLGLQSNAIFGRIAYENDGRKLFSEPIVLKMSPKTSKFGHSKYFQRCSFANEITFYVDFAPLYDAFRPCKLFPIFYNSLVESNAEGLRAVLVFQNLQASNYVPSKRKSFLDIRHLRIMVRKLGEFHAYSLKSRHEDENMIRIMAQSMCKVQVETLSMNERSLAILGERGMAPLSENAKYKDKIAAARKRLTQVDENVFDVLRGVTKDERDLLVLCHGDYLCSNVMFRYSDENDDVPVDMKMVDMANCRLASPVVDLALVLYMHTTQTIRDEYWDELIDEYYTALKTTFPQIEVPSLQQILREFQNRAFHVYYIASFFLGSLIGRDKNLPQIFELFPEEYKNVNYAKVPFEIRCEAYLKLGGTETTEALIDMVKDMIDRGFI